MRGCLLKMNWHFQKGREQSIDFLAKESELNPQIYAHLNSVIQLDIEGKLITFNQAFSQQFGYEEDDFRQPFFDVFLKNDLGEVAFFLKRASEGMKQEFDAVGLSKNGATIDVQVKLIPIRNKVNTVIYAIIKDMTEAKANDSTKIKEMEAKLNLTELKFKSIVEQAFIGVFILEYDGKISYGNPKFYEILGAALDEDINIWDYIHSADRSAQKSTWDQLINKEEGIDHPFRMIRKDGRQIDIEAHSKKVYLENDRPTIVGTIQDVTERKKAADLNKYLAYHDPLTSLPNRRLFIEELEKNIVISNTLQQKLAIMYLDLDRFKFINDTLGHSMGDKLLKKVSKRLKNNLRKNDVLARLGGDEFAVLLPNIYLHQIKEYALSLIKALEAPFLIKNYELFITTSIGISIYPNDGLDAEALMKNADSSLYKAKESGRNNYQIYSPSMNAETYKIFTLESDLRKALELQQFELYYQPKICTTTYRIKGAEALIRWNHPEWGVVSPTEFIPLAEETGLILEMGKWVKETACLQNKAWQEAGLRPLPISINLSAHRFLKKDLLDNLRNILTNTGLDPKFIELEITETSLLENEKAVFTILDELRSIGLKINLDDFGTGYSSLSYLKRFKGRIDTLKIDRSFTNDLCKEDKNSSNFITKAIIELAQHLDMDVIVEGVETIEQLELIKKYNCGTVQGYLFSKPVPAEEFAALLQKEKIVPITATNLSKNDQRAPSRLVLNNPLSASITLVKVHGRDVELGRTEIVIESIGFEGLQFLSNIKFTVHREIILECETNILGKMIKLYGAIVWMNEEQSGTYRYELEFTKAENEPMLLTELVDELTSLQM